MASRASSRTRVVLLGTAGGPDVRSRTGTAVVVDVGGALYRVDFGIGSSVQFMRADLDPGRIRASFVTHLHSDHVAELYTFFTANWYYLHEPTPIYGPPPDPRLRIDDGHLVIAPEAPIPGLNGTLRAFQRAYAYDNNIRVRDEAMPDLLDPAPGRAGIHPIELPADIAPCTTIFEDDRVRVSAALVDHPPVFPAYAFRFDTDAGSIVLSGDTTPCDALVRLARHADLLLHEVIDVDWVLDYTSRPGVPPELANHMLASHTPDRRFTLPDGTVVEGVGTVATRAGARRVVLYHLTPSFDLLPGGRMVELPIERWRDEVAADFAGPVDVGDDLAVYELTAD